MSHSTHNRSFQRRVFPGNQLHWYWQPNNNQTQQYIHQKHKRETEKTALANKTIYTLIWYGFYYLQSGNGVGAILTASEPTRGDNYTVLEGFQHINDIIWTALAWIAHWCPSNANVIHSLYSIYISIRTTLYTSRLQFKAREIRRRNSVHSPLSSLP